MILKKRSLYICRHFHFGTRTYHFACNFFMVFFLFHQSWEFCSSPVQNHAFAKLWLSSCFSFLSYFNLNRKFSATQTHIHKHKAIAITVALHLCTRVNEKLEYIKTSNTANYYIPELVKLKHEPGYIWKYKIKDTI